MNALDLAAKVNVLEGVPKTTGRLQYRNNVPTFKYCQFQMKVPEEYQM